ncbi:unnamed protein product, partial [Mesorhabditis spiculigera]
MMPQEYYSPTSGQLVVKWYCCPSEGCGRFYRDPEARSLHIIAEHSPRTWAMNILNSHPNGEPVEIQQQFVQPCPPQIPPQEEALDRYFANLKTPDLFQSSTLHQNGQAVPATTQAYPVQQSGFTDENADPQIMLDVVNTPQLSPVDMQCLGMPEYGVAPQPRNTNFGASLQESNLNGTSTRILVQTDFTMMQPVLPTKVTQGTQTMEPICCERCASEYQQQPAEAEEMVYYVPSEEVVEGREPRKRKIMSEPESETQKKQKPKQRRRRRVTDKLLLERIQRVSNKKTYNCLHPNLLNTKSLAGKRLGKAVIVKAFLECLNQGCVQRQNFWESLQQHLSTTHVERKKLGRPTKKRTLAIRAQATPPKPRVSTRTRSAVQNKERPIIDRIGIGFESPPSSPTSPRTIGNPRDSYVLDPAYSPPYSDISSLCATPRSEDSYFPKLKLRKDPVSGGYMSPGNSESGFDSGSESPVPGPPGIRY